MQSEPRPGPGARATGGLPRGPHAGLGPAGGAPDPQRRQDRADPRARPRPEQGRLRTDPDHGLGSEGDPDPDSRLPGRRQHLRSARPRSGSRLRRQPRGLGRESPLQPAGGSARGTARPECGRPGRRRRRPGGRDRGPLRGRPLLLPGLRPRRGRRGGWPLPAARRDPGRRPLELPAPRSGRHALRSPLGRRHLRAGLARAGAQRPGDRRRGRARALRRSLDGHHLDRRLRRLRLRHDRGRRGRLRAGRRPGPARRRRPARPGGQPADDGRVPDGHLRSRERYERLSHGPGSRRARVPEPGGLRQQHLPHEPVRPDRRHGPRRGRRCLAASPSACCWQLR